MTVDVLFNETDNTFNCFFKETSTAFNCIFGETNTLFKLDFGEIHTVTKFIGDDIYEGDYEVTPKVKAQTMPTANKFMTSDVTVKAIPFYVVGNLSGGETANIGE